MFNLSCIKQKKKKIGPYLLTGPIGSGQFGKGKTLFYNKQVVYKAVNTINNEQLAIKVVSK